MTKRRLWEERKQRIEIAAYFSSEKRAFHPGHEVEDWLRAEAEIDSTWRPNDDYWTEGVEELFESTQLMPDLFKAFLPLLPSLPEKTLVELATKTIIPPTANYRPFDMSPLWYYISACLTADSVPQILAYVMKLPDTKERSAGATRLLA
jgi:hypothetical protein